MENQEIVMGKSLENILSSIIYKIELKTQVAVTMVST